ncbi:MAG: DUF1570 domain-containing protein [Planctomycetes bacterium]|nr:DUF1570 domain-containing protein [Planctomycetota bacterium]
MLRFLVQTAGVPERTLDLEGFELTAGSDPSADLHLADPAASLRHFRIEVREGAAFLRDLGSGGVTKVNGEPASLVRLAVGDLVEVGRTRIIFALQTAGPAAAVAVPPIAAAPPPAWPAPAPAVTAAPPPPAAPLPLRGPSGPVSPRGPYRRESSPVAAVILVLLAAAAFAAHLLLRPEETARRPAREPFTPPSVAAARVPEIRLPVAGAGAAGFDPSAVIPVVPVEPVPAVPEPSPEGPTEPKEPADRPPPVPPDDASARAAADRARSEHERAERELAERTRREAEAREGYRKLDETIGARVARYSFAGPLADLEALLPSVPEGELRGLVLGRIDSLRRASRAFDRLRAGLGGGDRKLALSSGLTLVVTGTDEEGFRAKVSGAEIRKKWSELDPATVRTALRTMAGDAESRLDLAAFADLYSLDGAEEDLVIAFRADASVLRAINDMLARRRGTSVPAGGYVLHEDEWVTVEEKGHLERGLVKHDGRWMTKEEALVAQGFVKHEGRWLSPEDYQEVLDARREAEELAAKYLPKGLIDQPGNGAAVTWEKARELKSAHYRIRTNLSEEVARDIAYTMEILRTNLAGIFGLKGRGSTFTINVVGTQDEYRRAWPQSGGSLGFCSTSEICTFYQPPMTTGVLMHEGTHQMVRWLAPSCPRWLHEGMATFFECSRFAFDADRKKVRLEVGLLNANRLAGFQAELASNRAVSLETFMQGDGGNHYTQGWALVYYLAKGRDGQYARRLQPFLEEAHKTDVVDRFRKIFRVKDLKTFEAEWLAWVRAQNPADGVSLDSRHR